MGNWLTLWEPPKRANLSLDIPLSASEVVLYSRKSTADESSSKSLKDQDRVNVRTAQEFGLPFCDRNIFQEPAGYGGNIWYDGGGKWAGSQALRETENQGRKPRPKLTEIVQGIINKSYRCVICWDLDRLWRDVVICETLCDLFRAFQVQLYDRNGWVNIYSQEGMENVRQQALRAQSERLKARERTNRGRIACMEAGNILCTPTCLGIKQIRKSPPVLRFDEYGLNLVRRIMDLYIGDDPAGPLSFTGIAKHLNAKGYFLPKYVIQARSSHRVSTPRITRHHVRIVLRNVRYVGYHPTPTGVYPCKAFLKKDGTTLVPRELFDRVQEKLAREARIPRSARATNPFSGLVRCSRCAKSLSAHQARRRQDGVLSHEQVLIGCYSRDDFGCNIYLPRIPVKELLRYVQTELLDLLTLELENSELAALNASATSLETKQRYLSKLVHLRDVELLDRALNEWKDEPKLVRDLRKKLDTDIESTMSDIHRIETLASKIRSLRPNVLTLTTENVSDCRDAIRSLIRWIAVIPSNEIAKGSYGDRCSPCHSGQVGSLLFLMSTGSYHTATIYNQVLNNGLHGITLKTNDSVGSVVRLPHPDLFVKGLIARVAQSGVPFDYESEAIGYLEWRKERSTRDRVADGDTSVSLQSLIG